MVLKLHSDLEPEHYSKAVHSWHRKYTQTAQIPCQSANSCRSRRRAGVPHYYPSKQSLFNWPARVHFPMSQLARFNDYPKNRPSATFQVTPGGRGSYFCYQLCTILFEPLFALLVVWQDLFYLCPKLFGMVEFLPVTQFVYHNIIEDFSRDQGK